MTENDVVPPPSPPKPKKKFVATNARKRHPVRIDAKSYGTKTGVKITNLAKKGIR